MLKYDDQIWIINDDYLWEMNEDYIWIPIIINSIQTYICFKRKYFFSTKNNQYLFENNNNKYFFSTENNQYSFESNNDKYVFNYSR